MAKHSKTLRRGRGRSRSHISRRQKGGLMWERPPRGWTPQGGRSRRQRGGGRQWERPQGVMPP